MSTESDGIDRDELAEFLFRVKNRVRLENISAVTLRILVVEYLPSLSNLVETNPIKYL
jgi:hypothetical protein